jgi:hypothetical protein
MVFDKEAGRWVVKGVSRISCSELIVRPRARLRLQRHRRLRQRRRLPLRHLDPPPTHRQVQRPSRPDVMAHRQDQASLRCPMAVSSGQSRRHQNPVLQVCPLHLERRQEVHLRDRPVVQLQELQSTISCQDHHRNGPHRRQRSPLGTSMSTSSSPEHSIVIRICMYKH